MTMHNSNEVAMRGFDLSEALPENIRGAHVVVGKFEGVHIGHRALLNRASSLSSLDGRPVVALAFEQVGDSVASDSKQPYQLTDRQEKARLLRECGVDVIVTHMFDDMPLAASSFVDSVLVGRFSAKSLIVGQNFSLGVSRSLNSDALADAAARAGIVVQQMPPSAVGRRNHYVTSTAVHALIEAGDIKTVSACLGRRWTLDGIVVHGDKRGRELGFPTANLSLNLEVGLKFGVYAVRLLLNGRVIDGVACYGKRPQFDDGAPRLEVHLLDFCDDIYGEQVRIEFVDFQRAEMTFCSVDALIHQMAADCQDALRLIRRGEHDPSVVSTFDQRAA